jgi:formylglycine-generating enzyme required for sulfatase activity
MAVKKIFAVLAALLLLVLMACSSGSDDGGDTTQPKTYSITGQIISNSTGLAGVIVSLSGASMAQTITDSSGNYSFTGQSNGDYTVSPSLSGYVFSPSGTVVTISHTDKAGIDFTATASTTPTYSIFGTVGGAVTSGVTINLTGAATASTKTDSSGNYNFTGLSDGNYAVAPSKTGYTFLPSSTAITVSGANKPNINFTATTSTVPTYSISGTVSGGVLSGVIINLTGATTASTTTDSSGNYSFGNIANGNYTMTASKTGYTFIPVRSITVNGANITGQNFAATANTYNISGTVSGAVVSGVNITLTGTGSVSTTTDASGNYSFSGAANGSYTITPSMTGYTFNPTSSSLTVNNVDVTGKNFTSTANTYSISGTVTFSSVGLSGVIVRLTGTVPGSTTTDSSGNYNFSNVSIGNYTITPSLTDYTFNPTNRSITIINADVTKQNFTLATVAEPLIMVLVPAGSFQRDVTSTNISTVSAFRMSAREITRAQFIAVMGFDPTDTDYSTGANNPVQYVNWYHALVFCNKLSIREGLTPVYAISGSTNPDYWGTVPIQEDNATWDEVTANWSANGYRLPTEMEWMWAAMGATSGSGYTSGTYTTGYQKEFAGDPNPTTTGDNVLAYAWINENSIHTTSQPVGTKLSNELGLYDMSGNAYEWCWDWYANEGPLSNYAIITGAVTDYRGPVTGLERVIRGGSWSDSRGSVSVAGRLMGQPYLRGYSFGFRVVRP